jgi:outer membrane protein assembly factor BamE (lipoprotein component of BamABCDE complex)
MTMKGVLTLVAVGVVAVVVAIVIMLAHAANGLDASARQQTHAYQRAVVGYRHLAHGMNAARVRRLLGTPTDVDRYGRRPHREICWYYGGLLTTSRSYEFCFRNGKLVSKGRLP